MKTKDGLHLKWFFVPVNLFVFQVLCLNHIGSCFSRVAHQMLTMHCYIITTNRGSSCLFLIFLGGIMSKWCRRDKRKITIYAIKEHLKLFNWAQKKKTWNCLRLLLWCNCSSSTCLWTEPRGIWGPWSRNIMPTLTLTLNLKSSTWGNTFW